MKTIPLTHREEWKEIPGYPRYFVTKTGLIKGPKGIMRPMKAYSGHLYVFTYLNNNHKKLFIHRAILLSFNGPCPDGHECRHLDGNPRNNILENLRWGTRFEQREDSRQHGTLPIGEKSGTAKLTESQVLEIKKRVKNETLRALGAEYGVSHTAIRRAVNGMKWRYLHD